MIGRLLGIAAILLTLSLAVAMHGPTSATANVTPRATRLTEAQRLAVCARRHRGDWPALAACKVHVVWKGSLKERREAVRVGWCENRMRANDFRGTYWGAWQQDADARHTYGFGPTIVEQARSADLMHDARGWQPWPNCRPGGRDHAHRWAEAPRSLRAYG